MQIQHNRSVYRKHYDYHWTEYYELAKQRVDYWEKIKESLLLNATDNYHFKKRFRAVKWCYSNHPLCTLGSLKDPGGRFNIGDINPNVVPQFSALYIAQDKETAEKELLSYKNCPDISNFDICETEITI